MSSGLKALERLRGAPPPGLEEVMAKPKAAGPSRGTWVRTGACGGGTPCVQSPGGQRGGWEPGICRVQLGYKDLLPPQRAERRGCGCWGFRRDWRPVMSWVKGPGGQDEAGAGGPQVWRGGDGKDTASLQEWQKQAMRLKERPGSSDPSGGAGVKFSEPGKWRGRGKRLERGGEWRGG